MLQVYCTDVVARTPTELRQKHDGRGLLRPVRGDQSEHTGLFGNGALKFRHRLNRGAAEINSLHDTLYKSMNLKMSIT